MRPDFAGSEGRRASTTVCRGRDFPLYLHCPNCQASVPAALLDKSNPVCPHCGEPARTPLSLFASLPRRYRRRRGGRPRMPPLPGRSDTKRTAPRA